MSQPIAEFRVSSPHLRIISSLGYRMEMSKLDVLYVPQSCPSSKCRETLGDDNLFRRIN
jgi:hypothetical protein